ncbi:hypothetical protein ACROYT_G009799 [Oculina patagonica]
MKKHLVIVVWLLSAVLIDKAVSTGTLDQLSARTATPGAAGRPRSEIDLETDKSVIICAGQNKSLECFSPGSSIAIEEAFWGRLSAEICPSEDGDPVTNCLSDPTTTPIVRNLCDDKEYCEIPARHNVLQPPGVKHCPGVNKYLAVKYRCTPEKHKFVLCNGETTELQCGQGWKIHIMSAYWGRDSPSTCPTPLGKFFTCANSADSVLALRERCSGRESCIVTADDNHLTKERSHCPGIDKYALISYRCQPPGEVADPSRDSGKKLLELPQEDTLNTLHSSLYPTANSKTPSLQQAMGELNLSMLLPVPQYNRADKLKPIIDFLGEESGGKNQTTLTGETLPVPKDSHPIMSNKKDSSSSPAQNGIAPSAFAKQNGISSSTKLHLTDNVSSSTSAVNSVLGSSKSQAAVISQSIQANEASTLGSVRPLQTVNHNSASATTDAVKRPLELSTNPTQKPQVSTAIQPLEDITEGLVKSFLSSKFGQALGKSLLDSGTIEDSSYKNILAQHFGSSAKPTSSPAKQIPANQDLIANLVSGLIHKPTKQDSTGNSALNKNNEKEISKPVKQDSTNNLSSPTVSIGNKVFSLTDLANSLLNEKPASSKSKNVNKDIHPVKQRNKEKIRRLDEKIATLETLSDALDALTNQLSPDETSEGEQKHKEISLSSDKPIIQEQRPNKHHTHHHKSDPFSEDLDMLSALLARDTTLPHTEKKKPVVSKNDKDSTTIVGIKGKKGLSSADLEMLQNKINQAIEMAEAVGRQHNTASQAKSATSSSSSSSSSSSASSFLPLLMAGKVSEDVGAQTREEVAKIHTNSVASKGTLPSKDHEMQSLQAILTRLIDSAMRKGTLNQLVQTWGRSGSPFADIAKNISLYLQGNSKLKTPISRLGSKQTAVVTQPKTNTGATVQTNLTSLLAKGIAGLTGQYSNFTSSTGNNLFTKAVNNIISALSKRQGLHKGNSTNRSSFVTTDTLTDFKGVLLGGRINKLKHVPIADSMVGLESKILAEILKGHGNKSFSTNTSGPANFTIGNKAGGKSGNKFELLHGNHTLQKPVLGEQGKQKLTYSSYGTKNVSRTLRNNTLMDFMKSMEEPGGPPHLQKNNNTKNNIGNKHSKVKPHVNDLMSVIAASLLDLGDIQQDSSSKTKPKLRYEETGKEKLLHGFPNDHKMSDFSRDDAVLQAPSDHAAAKTNSSNKRPSEQHNSTESSTNIIMLQNNTKGFLQSETPKSPDEESQKVDLGDQTVTLTLETVDDTPTPSPETNQGPKTQTGLRNNKVPHYLNLHSAVTLGKINATSIKNIEHSFPQSQIQEVPTALSDFNTEAKKPEIALPSDGDGKLMTISPSPELNPGFAGDFQTKSKPELPLGLQMNAIGRIAESDDKTSVTPDDLSAALTSTAPSELSAALSSTAPSELSSALASKTGEAKSFEDKILPMASDLTSVTDAKGGETESIVSKASSTSLENPSIIHKPSYTGATARSAAMPTASEVREMATSIKALLKILSSYSKKLRLEEDGDDSPSGVLPTRSRTANRVSVDSKNTNKEKMINPPSSGVTATKFNADVYANIPPSSITLPKYADSGVLENIHPPSSITLPKYADSGVFENIQEQPPNAEASNYNWNLGTEQAHPQMPFDINPTKTSLEPQLGANQWRPGNEASETEALKDLNLPSIEDDPTVRAVQNMVAEENAYISEKRKAIQKHKQQDLGVKSQLPGTPGVIGRNTIPKHKGHQQNKSRIEHEKNKKKVANFGKRNDTKKAIVRGRDEIPRHRSNKHPRQNVSAVGKRKPAIQGNTTHHGNKQTSSPPGMMGNSGNTTQSVSSRDKIPGNRESKNAFNNSAPVSRDNKKTFKIKHDLKKGLLSVHRPNATKTAVANTLKIHDHRNPKVKPFGGEKLSHGLNITKVIGDKRNLHPMKLGKTYDVPKRNAINSNGTASKLKHVRAQKATPNIS